jgi:hypothetical protein
MPLLIMYQSKKKRSHDAADFAPPKIDLCSFSSEDLRPVANPGTDDSTNGIEWSASPSHTHRGYLLSVFLFANHELIPSVAKQESARRCLSDGRLGIFSHGKASF